MANAYFVSARLTKAYFVHKMNKVQVKYLALVLRCDDSQVDEAELPQMVNNAVLGLIPPNINLTTAWHCGIVRVL